jgi:hypothetical protein
LIAREDPARLSHEMSEQGVFTGSEDHRPTIHGDGPLPHVNTQDVRSRDRESRTPSGQPGHRVHEYNAIAVVARRAVVTLVDMEAGVAENLDDWLDLPGSDREHAYVAD